MPLVRCTLALGLLYMLCAAMSPELLCLRAIQKVQCLPCSPPLSVVLVSSHFRRSGGCILRMLRPRASVLSCVHVWGFECMVHAHACFVCCCFRSVRRLVLVSALLALPYSCSLSCFCWCSCHVSFCLFFWFFLLYVLFVVMIFLMLYVTLLDRCSVIFLCPCYLVSDSCYGCYVAQLLLMFGLIFVPYCSCCFLYGRCVGFLLLLVIFVRLFRLVRPILFRIHVTDVTLHNFSSCLVLFLCLFVRAVFSMVGVLVSCCCLFSLSVSSVSSVLFSLSLPLFLDLPQHLPANKREALFEQV